VEAAGVIRIALTVVTRILGEFAQRLREQQVADCVNAGAGECMRRAAVLDPLGERGNHVEPVHARTEGAMLHTGHGVQPRVLGVSACPAGHRLVRVNAHALTSIRENG